MTEVQKMHPVVIEKQLNTKPHAGNKEKKANGTNLTSKPFTWRVRSVD